jgi:hypothetical protein
MNSQRFLPTAGVVAGLTAALIAMTARAAPAAIEIPKVRPSALAGGWYPAQRAAVEVEIHRLLRAAAVAPAIEGKPIALIVPHAGWKYSGAAAATAWRTLHRGDFGRVVVVAPTHHGDFEGFAIDDVQIYRTPLGDIPLAADAIAALRDDKVIRKVEGATEPEHAVEIELPFLQETLGSFTLVPILAGRTTPAMERQLAGKLAALNDGATLFVFSSDFTHYGPRFSYMPYGPTASALQKIHDLNVRAINLLSRLDPAAWRAYLAETGNSICGHVGITVMLEMLSMMSPRPNATLLAHYASGEMAGVQDDSSVSYVAIAYTRGKSPAGRPLEAPPSYAPLSVDAPPITAADGEKLVRLARATIRTALTGAEDLNRELTQFPKGPDYERLQGIFVTLNRTDPAQIASEGKLRGCIGQIFPALPMYEAVVDAANNAALHDPRFLPVQAQELDHLEVEVTALSSPKPVASYEEIRIGTHGILIEKEGHRAVFLPQVPGEQGWNLEMTLTELSLKAGLPRDAWREGARFSVFTGQVFKEKHSS